MSSHAVGCGEVGWDGGGETEEETDRERGGAKRGNSGVNQSDHSRGVSLALPH